MSPEADPSGRATDSPVVRLGRARLGLGEGASWHDGRWVFVDLLAGRLLAHDGGESDDPRVLLEIDQPIGRAVPSTDGTWLGVAGDGFVRIELDRIDRDTGQQPADVDLEWLARPERGTGRRMNDAGVDTHGRLWGGSMHWHPEDGSGWVHRLAANGSSDEILGGLRIPNGPVFSADGTTMLLADSYEGVVYRYELDAAGDPGDRDEFVRYDEGSPDGMALDRDGNVWVAVWGRGFVDHRDQAGGLIRRVHVPATQPACPALGGSDGRTLLVTTAATGLDGTALDGGLYLCHVDIPGATPQLAHPVG